MVGLIGYTVIVESTALLPQLEKIIRDTKSTATMINTILELFITYGLCNAFHEYFERARIFNNLYGLRKYREPINHATLIFSCREDQRLCAWQFYTPSLREDTCGND